MLSLLNRGIKQTRPFFDLMLEDDADSTVDWPEARRRSPERRTTISALRDYPQLVAFVTFDCSVSTWAGALKFDCLLSLINRGVFQTRPFCGLMFEDDNDFPVDWPEARRRSPERRTTISALRDYPQLVAFVTFDCSVSTWAGALKCSRPGPDSGRKLAKTRSTSRIDL
jgi:hypothetical protein